MAGQFPPQAPRGERTPAFGVPAPPPPRAHPTPAPPRDLSEGLPPELVYPWDPPGKPLPRRRRRVSPIRLVLLALLILFVAFTVRAGVFLAAVSTEPLWSAHFWPVGGRRDANVLIMGYGGQGHDGAYLTDSLLLLHSDLPSGRTAQLSLPRDLWVQIPPDSGRYAKLNSAYAYAGGGDDPVAGGGLATTKAGQVTGLPTDRWVAIDFRGFRALVDALGGVEVDVERAFTAQYPANDDPAIDPSWLTISFAAGPQRMDGETAIRYARARYSDDPLEGSDFARSQRQQRLVAAIVGELKRPTSWWRAFGVMGALQPALRTNLAPADLATLALRADTANARRIRLDEADILVNETAADGQAILVPRGGDYGLITRYVAAQLAEH